MAKPDSWRLDPANYPFSLEIPTRYGDLDTNKHLNNVAYARFFEEGRVRYQLKIRARDHFAGRRGLIASLTVNYLAEGGYPRPVTVTAGFGPSGRTSWQILLAAFQKDRCIATCDSLLVGRDEAGPAPLTDAWRMVIESQQVRSR